MPAWLRIFLFFPFLLLLMWGVFRLQSWRIAQRSSLINSQVGKIFPRLPLLDEQGLPAVPDFALADYTLVDCWFRDCPYCLAEMRQFHSLPGGDTLQILSISIDPLAEWQAVLRGSDRRWAFLQEHRDNWKHRLLDAKGGGENPAAQMLADSLGVTSYPSFLLVDRKGRIVAVPRSAQDWQPEKKPAADPLRFLTDSRIWSPFRYALVVFLALLLYRQLLRWLPGKLRSGA